MGIKYKISQDYTATVIRVIGPAKNRVASLTNQPPGTPLMKAGDLIVRVDGYTRELPLPVGIIPIELITDIS